ncbi:MAG TPA: glycosyltransferase family 2 protein [Solirubrobacteraceae bacterium]
MVSRVTAVVLTYDGRDLLDILIPSLRAQRYSDMSIVIVDNGSSDGTAGHVNERWPDARLIEIPVNIGVAAALNRGVRAADGEYVALLNNDLELEPDWLGALVGVLDRHPEAASATGKLLNFHRRRELDAAGDLMRWSGAPDQRGHGEPDRGQYDDAVAVFSPCAGAALYRRSSFDAVGLFDEDFFAYMEDIDWGFRAQLAGFASRYEPAAVAYHVGGATTAREPGRYVALQRRNQILLVLKNYPLAALVRHAPAILLHQAGWVASSRRDGVLREHVAALRSAARAVPGTVRKRRPIQRGRRATVAQLTDVMSPEVYAGSTPRERLRSMARAAAPLLRRS